MYQICQEIDFNNDITRTFPLWSKLESAQKRDNCSSTHFVGQLPNYST